MEDFNENFIAVVYDDIDASNKEETKDSNQNFVVNSG